MQRGACPLLALSGHTIALLGHSSITNTVRYTAMSPEPFKDIWR